MSREEEYYSPILRVCAFLIQSLFRSTAEGTGPGPSLLPDWPLQGVFQSWCASSAGGGERHQAHGDHCTVPVMVQRLPRQEVRT